MIWQIILIFFKMSPTICCTIGTSHLFKKQFVSISYIVGGIPYSVIENLLLLIRYQVNFGTLCCYFALH